MLSQAVVVRAELSLQGLGLGVSMQVLVHLVFRMLVDVTGICYSYGGRPHAVRRLSTFQRMAKQNG